MSSNSKTIQTGSSDVTLLGVAYNADHSIKTDLAHNTSGISIYVQRKGAADGSPLGLSAKATSATSHSDGAFLNLTSGDISVDIPDGPLAGYLGEIRIVGTFTGGYIVGDWYQVVAYDPTDAQRLGLTALPSTGSVASPADVSPVLITAQQRAVTRALDNETPIYFVWPTNDTEITIRRSLNASAYEDADGVASFLRTEGLEHWYVLSYEAADRQLGVVRYELTDGDITKYLSLLVTAPNPFTEIMAESDTYNAVYRQTSGPEVPIEIDWPTTEEDLTLERWDGEGWVTASATADYTRLDGESAIYAVSGFATELLAAKLIRYKVSDTVVTRYLPVILIATSDNSVKIEEIAKNTGVIPALL